MTPPDIRESEVTTPPNAWVPERTDADGRVWPGHTVIMTGYRVQQFELDCATCGKLHHKTLTMTADVAAWPELLERSREVARHALLESAEACRK